MRVREHVSLAPLTSFRVGGPARFFVEAQQEEDVRTAGTLAHEHGLPLLPLGGGTNLLVPDVGVEAVVLKMDMNTCVFETYDDTTVCVADAGALWDHVVSDATRRGLWGVENLAGIPGSVGGAVVQNIGAYGADLSAVLTYAEAIDTTTGALVRITLEAAALGYRSSIFKTRRELVVTRVALTLAHRGRPNLTYPDLARLQEVGAPLATPTDIAGAVRTIRSQKFPKGGAGTAGSFFKNPVISSVQAAALVARYPGLPTFPQAAGGVKVSLAWLLDHALSLKGVEAGRVRLYERQPLVLVASSGATASDIDTFASYIAKRVHDALDIVIEREVETFGARV